MCELRLTVDIDFLSVSAAERMAYDKSSVRKLASARFKARTHSASELGKHRRDMVTRSTPGLKSVGLCSRAYGVKVDH